MVRLAVPPPPLFAVMFDALLTWIIDNGRTIAAWGIVVGAVAAAVAAVHSSGVLDDVRDRKSSIVASVRSIVNYVPSKVAPVKQGIAETNDHGWGSLFLWLLCVDDILAIIALVGANFQALMIACCGILVLCALLCAVFFTQKQIYAFASALGKFSTSQYNP